MGACSGASAERAEGRVGACSWASSEPAEGQVRAYNETHNKHEKPNIHKQQSKQLACKRLWELAVERAVSFWRTVWMLTVERALSLQSAVWELAVA